MSAAIAALASYGGSDSEPDSEPEADGGPQRAVVLASRDAVLHLRPPPAAPPALPVDAAPEVAVKVRERAGAEPTFGVWGRGRGGGGVLLPSVCVAVKGCPSLRPAFLSNCSRVRKL